MSKFSMGLLVGVLAAAAVLLLLVGAVLSGPAFVRDSGGGLERTNMILVTPPGGGAPVIVDLVPTAVRDDAPLPPTVTPLGTAVPTPTPKTPKFGPAPGGGK